MGGPIKRSRFKVVPLRVRLAKVLDLCNPNLLALLKITEDELRHPSDVVLPRKIAQGARSLGIEALIAPSAAHPGKMLAVFFGCPGSRIEDHDREAP